MPPKRKNRATARAASTASTPTNIPDSDSAMPDVDDENTIKASPLKSPVHSTPAPSRNRGAYKEPVNDEWTDEQDTSLFKGLIQWKPVGMHRHFRMINISMYLHNHGYDPETETHTRPEGIWKHLGKYFDLETLGEREDHIVDDNPADPQFVEFSLPEEFQELMWKKGERKHDSTTLRSYKGKFQNEGDMPKKEDDRIMEGADHEIESWNSSPPHFNPSETPPATRKRKRGDTITHIRGSTVEDTDDAASSVNSPAAAPAAAPAPSTSRSVRSNKRAATRASGSRQASKDITVDEEESRAGDDENGGETDDTASVKATTRSNTKTAKTNTQTRGQSTTRKSGRKR